MARHSFVVVVFAALCMGFFVPEAFAVCCFDDPDEQYEVNAQIEAERAAEERRAAQAEAAKKKAAAQKSQTKKLEVGQGTNCEKKADLGYYVADYQMQNSLAQPYSPEVLNDMEYRGQISRKDRLAIMLVQQSVKFGWTPVKAKQEIYMLCQQGKL